ncbi:MAG: endolytic transglycosylase MltG [Muribaculaceae bacterium]|nr:endolytic transglycosylase MltG [Muribaculaceae bacterium]
MTNDPNINNVPPVIPEDNAISSVNTEESYSTLPPLPPVPPAPRRTKKGLIALFICVAAVLAIAAIWIAPMLLNGTRHSAVIRIPAHASIQNVTDSLSKYFGESYANKTVSLIKLSGVSPDSRHGAYNIPVGTTPARAARRLTHGAQQPMNITVNGQRTLPQLAAYLSERLDFSADSLIKAATDPALLAQYDLTPEQSMALFLNDTYEVYWTVSPRELLDKIGANYRRFWNDKRRAKASNLGLSPAEIMTVCSIVDEESNKADEKGTIGRLYINRLHKGMKLQADPTVRYATGDFTIRRIQGVHLKTPSPYNTYLNKGLPPGPIRTGSAKTIDLVLDAAPTDALYMCARSDFSGYHDFASTYSEHQENARQYHKALNARGIK